MHALYGNVVHRSLIMLINLPFVRTALSTMPLLWELGQWNEALLFPRADQEREKKRGGVFRVYLYCGPEKQQHLV